MYCKLNSVNYERTTIICYVSWTEKRKKILLLVQKIVLVVVEGWVGKRTKKNTCKGENQGEVYRWGLPCKVFQFPFHFFIESQMFERRKKVISGSKFFWKESSEQFFKEAERSPNKEFYWVSLSSLHIIHFILHLFSWSRDPPVKRAKGMVSGELEKWTAKKKL